MPAIHIVTVFWLDMAFIWEPKHGKCYKEAPWP